VRRVKRERTGVTRRVKKKSRPIRKKRIKKAASPRRKPAVNSEKKILVGEVTHYFDKISVAVIRVSGKGLSVMDPIEIKGVATDLRQTVSSMQINRKDIDRAVSGDDIGLKVSGSVRPGDRVFKLQL
jgi:putative protease